MMVIMTMMITIIILIIHHVPCTVMCIAVAVAPLLFVVVARLNDFNV